MLVDSAPPGIAADAVVIDNYAASFAATTYHQSGHASLPLQAAAGLPGERARGFAAALHRRGWSPAQPCHAWRHQPGGFRAVSVHQIGSFMQGSVVANNQMLVGSCAACTMPAFQFRDVIKLPPSLFPWASAFRPAPDDHPPAGRGSSRDAVRLLRARISDTIAPSRNLRGLSSGVGLPDSRDRRHPADPFLIRSFSGAGRMPATLQCSLCHVSP